MAYNLAELSTATVNDVTYDVEIEHPVVGETGMIVRVIGVHADKVRSVRDQQTNDLLKHGFETQRNKAKSSNALTVEGNAKRNAKLLAVATVGWFTKEDQGVGKKAKIEPGFEWDGGRLQFSIDEAEKLYADPAYEWLTKQVDEAVGELGNFIKS